MKANDGAFVRKNFFGRHPKPLEMVAKMSDDDIWRLQPRRPRSAEGLRGLPHAPSTHKGQPTVLLIKTVKGFGMGKAGEGKNTAHQTKKLTDDDIRAFRDRFNIPIPDDKLADIPFYKPADDTPEMKYLHERRKALGGYLPQAPRQGRRAAHGAARSTPSRRCSSRRPKAARSSTTQAYVRFLTQLLRDKELGPRVVPILVDEARTFGMEGLFRQIGIYNPEGQKYTPVRQGPGHRTTRKTRPARSCRKASTKPAAWPAGSPRPRRTRTNNRIMVPFYIYYSMFGFQRIGDLAWAAGDMQARGFLLGGTSGRTTLNGEGLQHEDGHSHILAGTIPNCVSYDPTFAHEVGVIMHHGLKRMVEKQDNVFYYITLLNENYPMPGLQARHRGADHQGHVPAARKAPRRQAARAAAGQRHHPARVASPRRNCWRRTGAWRPTSGAARASTSWRATARTASAGTCCTRRRRRACPSSTQQLDKHAGPVVASTDYMKAYAEQIRAFIPKGRTYKVLGTDGFGRSDFRSKLREHFEVNRHYIVVAALKALAEEGAVPAAKVAEAIKKYGIKADKINPLYA